MEIRRSLTCHADTPATFIGSVDVELAMTDADDVLLTFIVSPASALLIPTASSPARADGLWQRTCFEMFIATPGRGYLEFNLSPSSQWAAYAFSGYRDGMRDFDVAVDPHIETSMSGDAFELQADIDLAGTPPGPLTLALSAVIEEIDGTKSYWALRHPPGQPDFHHADCFALHLP